MWVWLGEPALAGLRPPAATPWLSDPAWATLGDEWETEADVLLLHENFADITHVAVVDPYIAPPVLRSSPPPLEVEVTETTVSFSRTYQPAPIPEWQAELLGLPADAEHVQREQGALCHARSLGRPVGCPRRLCIRPVSDTYLPLYTRGDTDLPGQNAACMAGEPKLRAR